MRVRLGLVLIAVGGALVHSTRENLPGFSALRALGLALLAAGAFALLPRYPGRSHPAAPAMTPDTALGHTARPHVAGWPATAPVLGPAFARSAHQLVPMPALPAPAL